MAALLLLSTLILSSCTIACPHHAEKRAASEQDAQLLDRAIQALGGEDALSALNGVSYLAPDVFRSQSLMQSYDLFKADQYVSIQGSQNVSFSFSNDGTLRQRIDRNFIPSPYWLWAKGNLEAVDFSLVVQEGDQGFACYVDGNAEIHLEANITEGYTDAELAEYLVARARMLNPKLISQIRAGQAYEVTNVTLNDNVELPAVSDPTLNITMIFNTTSYLPYMIRSYEEHPIFGPCSFNIQLTNYTSVNGLQFPQRIQTIYTTPQGSDAVLEDFLIESIQINPTFSSNYFNGLPQNQSSTPKVAPLSMAKDEFAHADIGEAWSNVLYASTVGPVGNLSATHPADDLAHVWTLRFQNTAYAQLIIELADAVIVADAPQNQINEVIQWVNQTLGKPITHFWPSHHHRDHTGGARFLVDIGAKIITPEVAVPYWSSLPNATLVTYNDTHPLKLGDDTTQAWFMWTPDTVHAVDWSYSMVMAAHPNSTSNMVVFEADVWDIATDAIKFDIGYARRWVDQLASDKLAMSATVVPAHGLQAPLSNLLDITGYTYPPYTPLDWRSS